MDLLLEIKKFYDILVENKIKENIPFDNIEKAAEAVYNDKWKTLTDEIKIGYTNEVIIALTNQLEVIKETVKNEKDN